jgi:uncharacterized membrane protein
MSEVKFKYKGKFVSAEELDQLMPRKVDWLESPSMAANTYTEHNPLVSEGCGVMKSQVDETRDLIKRHNIQGAAVRNSGQVQFTSRRARNEFLKMRGFHDMDGGYGDE